MCVFLPLLYVLHAPPIPFFLTWLSLSCLPWYYLMTRKNCEDSHLTALSIQCRPLNGHLLCEYADKTYMYMYVVHVTIVHVMKHLNRIPPQETKVTCPKCSLMSTSHIICIMLFFHQRNILYFVYLARLVSTLEGHHQVLQIIYLQLLICDVTFILHTICF
jgi:hypothetical protein